MEAPTAGGSLATDQRTNMIEDLLTRVDATGHRVHDLLERPEEPVAHLQKALDEYRTACLDYILFDFEHAEIVESRLWYTHTQTRKFFNRALANLRKQAESEDRSAAVRGLIKLYLTFLKTSDKFYRRFIHELHTYFGGIPELEDIANQVPSTWKDALGEPSQQAVSQEVRVMALIKCHSALIYLGDLSRYRATDALDKEPDFGPAMGYYGLACTLRPISGMGSHQLAAIALVQRHHLRAIYFLYRSMMSHEPHPNAEKNLRLEFGKINEAWDKGELIQGASPNHPDGPKNTLVGWFVRLHSLCYKGEPFRGFEELEREVLSQLVTVIKQHDLDSTFLRMVLINLSAQHDAAINFSTPQYQTAFLHFLRLNIKTFTTLLQVFHDELKAVGDRDVVPEEGESLVHLLTPVLRRVLPGLRLYSIWLLPSTTLLHGLSSDKLIGDPVREFWVLYARTLDFIMQAFSIWDLEELPDLTYMLPEEADTIGFNPLIDAKTNKVWTKAESSTAADRTSAFKPRFHDRGVVRLHLDNEMLHRVRIFMADGLELANNDEQAPITLRGTRMVFGDVNPPFVLPRRFQEEESNSPAVIDAPNRKPEQSHQLINAAVASPDPNDFSARPGLPSGGSSGPPSQMNTARLRRMVDELVDEDDEVDSNDPVTPSPPHPINNFPTLAKSLARPHEPYTPLKSDLASSPHHTHPVNALERLSISSIWDDATAQPAVHGSHSRVPSSGSARFGNWLATGSPASSVESVARCEEAITRPPMLFGAGGGLWSTGAGVGGLGGG